MPTAKITSIGKAATPNGEATQVPDGDPDRNFAELAIAELARVVALPEFLERVRQATFSSAFRIDPLSGAKSTLTSLAVANIIDSGREGGSPKTNHSIDLSIVLTDLPPKTFAITHTNEIGTSTDTDFFAFCFEKNDLGNLAAVWMHEWMHSAGFVHATRAGDDLDVPYTVQSIVRALSPAPGKPAEDALSFLHANRTMNRGVRWNCPITLAAARRRHRVDRKGA